MSPLGDFSPPRASDALRSRVLSRAREAAVASTRPTRADRIWFSRGWRFAWAATLAAMIVLELFSARAIGGRGESATTSPAVVSESGAAAEAMGLPAGGWIGARVATNDANQGDVVAEAL